MSRGKQITPPIVIDEASLGPAMLALSPAMRVFVLAKVNIGANNTRAAQLAGYSDASAKGLNVTGHRLGHDPRVQAAILEESHKLMRSEGPNSIRTLVSLRDDAEVEPKDRIKCAVELLNRSGFHAITESIAHVEHHLSDREKDARILALCAELGIAADEARKMLIAPAASKDAIDAAYEVVPAEPPRELTEEEKQEAAKREHENEQRRARRAMTPEELAEHKAKMQRERIERSKREHAEHRGDQSALTLELTADDWTAI